MKKVTKKAVRKVKQPKKVVEEKKLSQKDKIDIQIEKDFKEIKDREKVEGEVYWQNRRRDDDRRDWHTKSKDWVSEYVESKGHPHRELILVALKTFEPFAGVLEVGCNAGPNLIRISEQYPETQMAGFDINPDCVLEAQRQLPKALLQIGTALHIPFADKEFDIGIADAVFMYVKDIERALQELDRVVRKGIIIIDWYAENEKIADHHYARNFPDLLQKLGYEVDIINLNEDLWPSKNWVKNGRVFVCRKALQTSKTS